MVMVLQFDGWRSGKATDHDGDGCMDGTAQDRDADNDGVPDDRDKCARGMVCGVVWSSVVCRVL